MVKSLQTRVASIQGILGDISTELFRSVNRIEGFTNEFGKMEVGLADVEGGGMDPSLLI